MILEIGKEKGFKVEILTQKFKIKQYYPWHRKEVHEFLVDIYLLTKN